MSYSYNKSKKDSTHQDIENAYRSAGYETIDVSSLRSKYNFDFIAFNWSGDIFLIEAKSGNKKLTKKEAAASGKYGNRFVKICSVKEAVDHIQKAYDLRKKR